MNWNDLDDLDGGKQDSNAEIRKNAHVVNGGEATFTCPACRGSKVFKGYSGRVVGACFRCKGEGTVGRRQIAAAKGQQTRKENIAKWREAHAAEIRYMATKADGGFQLMAKLQNKLREYDTLRGEDIATIRKYMAQDAERATKRAEEREAAAPVVTLSAIDALFAMATENEVKRPVFRADGVTLSKAPTNGNNAGALYVKSNDGVYYGKIKDGKFYATREAPRDTGEKLQAIAADPLAESIKYARKTGNCGCCGRGLVDPISILAGIGPICAENYGLDYLREIGADRYAEIKAEEAAKKNK
jgi:hypothetical protein